MEFKAGQRYHMLNNQHRIGRTKIHIVAVIEDDGHIIIVYKWYGLHKQWWHYEIESQYAMDLMIQFGQLVKTK